MKPLRLVTYYTYKPNYSSTVGDTVNDILEEYAISRLEFAEKALAYGISFCQVYLLLERDTPMTPQLAQMLEHEFTVPVTFWLQRDLSYRLSSGL